MFLIGVPVSGSLFSSGQSRDRTEWAAEAHVTFQVNDDGGGCECFAPSIDSPANGSTFTQAWNESISFTASYNGCDDPATENWNVDDTTNFQIDSGLITATGDLTPGDYPLVVTYSNECDYASISITVTIVE